MTKIQKEDGGVQDEKYISSQNPCAPIRYPSRLFPTASLRGLCRRHRHRVGRRRLRQRDYLSLYTSTPRVRKRCGSALGGEAREEADTTIVCRTAIDSRYCDSLSGMGV